MISKFKAWILAARPQTLTGAVAPILIATSFMATSIEHSLLNRNNSSFYSVAILCFLFALIMQIDANFINDYYDFKNGKDSENRVGPRRACAQGWISPKEMKRGILITSILSCCVGLPLIRVGGFSMIFVGIICVLAAFMYSQFIASWGKGDIFVVLFFGLVPVFFTSFLLYHTLYKESYFYSAYFSPSIILGFAMGLVTDTLLLVNNYRDYSEDSLSGKRTLVVRYGREWGIKAYFVCGIVAISLLLFIPYLSNAEDNHILLIIRRLSFMLPYLNIHIILTNKLKKWSNNPSLLNKHLKYTGLNIFFFAILFSLSCL